MSDFDRYAKAVMVGLCNVAAAAAIDLEKAGIDSTHTRQAETAYREAAARQKAAQSE